MFEKSLNNILGNGENQSKKRTAPPKGRKLQIESLESREMLSVSPLTPLDTQLEPAIYGTAYVAESQKLGITAVTDSSATTQTFHTDVRRTVSVSTMIFNIYIDATSIDTSQQATLTLRLNDRDFPSYSNANTNNPNEDDIVYFNGVRLTNTSWTYEPGSNVWSRRVFNVPTSLLKLGNNTIGIEPHCPADWEVHCDWAELTVGVEDEKPEFHVETESKYKIPTVNETVTLKAVFDTDISKYTVDKTEWIIMSTLGNNDWFNVQRITKTDGSTTLSLPFNTAGKKQFSCVVTLRDASGKTFDVKSLNDENATLVIDPIKSWEEISVWANGSAQVGQPAGFNGYVVEEKFEGVDGYALVRHTQNGTEETALLVFWYYNLTSPNDLRAVLDQTGVGDDLYRRFSNKVLTGLISLFMSSRESFQRLDIHSAAQLRKCSLPILRIEMGLHLFRNLRPFSLAALHKNGETCTAEVFILLTMWRRAILRA